MARRLQDAFAEGRLDDQEFDSRMRAALTARMSTDLEALTGDLPDTVTAPGAAAIVPAGKPARRAISYKGPLRRSGRWRVPERFTSVVYKGSGLLDLRAAELAGPVTTVLAISYKSRTDILVPPGVRVELQGYGVNRGSADTELESCLPANAPIVHVRGVGYKGTIEVSTKPRGQAPAGPHALPA